MSSKTTLRELMLKEISGDPEFPELSTSQKVNTSKSDNKTILFGGEMLTLHLDFSEGSLSQPCLVPWPAPKPGSTLEQSLTRSLDRFASEAKYIKIRIDFGQYDLDSEKFVALQSQLIESVADSISGFADVKYLHVIFHLPKYIQPQIYNGAYFHLVGLDDWTFSYKEGDEVTVTTTKDSQLSRSLLSTAGKFRHKSFLNIPDRTVPHIIGHGGRRIAALRDETRCFISIPDKSKSTDGLHEISLMGSRSRVRVAKAKIESLVREHEAEGEVMIPESVVGLIIGRNGGNVKSIEERSGCRVVRAFQDRVKNGHQPIRLFGTPESVALAKELILSIVARNNKGSG